MYRTEIWHYGLNKRKVITCRTIAEGEEKVARQKAIWDEMWRKKIAQENKRCIIEENKAQAKQTTDSLNNTIQLLENILKYSVETELDFDWKLLKENSPFNEPKPTPPKYQPPKYEQVPKAPDKNDLCYQVKLGLLGNLRTKKKTVKYEEMERRYQQDYNKWLRQKEYIDTNNSNNLHNYNEQFEKKELKYKELLERWEQKEKAYLERQQEKNALIDNQRLKYLNGDPIEVVNYCYSILNMSEYPIEMPKIFEIDYISETKTLLVDYFLPNIDIVPKVKEVKYIQSQDVFKESYYPQSFINNLYDNLLYQITLRSIYELYMTDKASVLGSIVFNGWINSIDKATGKECTACIISIHTQHEEFLNYNLEDVEPKECFKSLVGVGSSKLHSQTPIAPIININRDDKRFVSSHTVTEGNVRFVV